MRRAIESLEWRRTLSVTVADDVMSLIGTGNADTFVVARSGTNATVSENGGPLQSFPLGQIASINALLGNGSDSVRIADDIFFDATLDGGSGNDTLIAGGGNDLIDPGTGNDSIEGGPGDDVVTHVSRNASISGGLSVHYIGTATPRTITVTGTAGASGESDNFSEVENLSGGNGNDSLSIGTDDYLGDTFELPTSPIFRINGNGGNDYLSLRADFGDTQPLGLPTEVADGGDGNDEFFCINSRSDATTLIGGAGDDTFSHFSDDESSTIDAGPGFDEFTFLGLGLQNYTMPSGLEKLIVRNGTTITGNDLDNVIEGDARFINSLGGNDRITIVGQSAYNVDINAGSGNDTVTTHNGIDTIHGGEGHDVINPGQGDNTVFGEGGDDILQFISPTGSGASGLNGLTTFDGGPDADRVLVDDTLVDGDFSYTLTSTRLSRSATDGVIFSGVGQLDLNCGGGADAVAVTSLPTNLQVFLNTGAGVDNILVAARNSFSMVNVATGAGDDALRVESPAPSNARARINSAETLGDLKIANLSELEIAPSVNEDNVLRVRSLTLDAQSRLDVANNPFILDYDGASQLAAVTALLRLGYTNGTWSANGLRSSTAAATPGTTLGVAATTEFSPTLTSFAGQDVDNTAVVVRYTRAGDINLDRAVNFQDLVVLAQNYDQTGRSYARGNINYTLDGKVDFADLVILAQQYNTSILSTLPPKGTVQGRRTDAARGGDEVL